MDQSPALARGVMFVTATRRPPLSLLVRLLAVFLWGVSASALADVNPVGYWPLDEGSGTTTADSSGHGATATISGATWVAGQINNALNFSTATANANASGGGALADLYLTGLTVSAWINPASAGGAGKGRIVDKNAWFFSMNNSSSISFTADQFATTAAVRISTANIALNGWQHVVATWDGSTSGSNIHLYINGVLSDGTPTNGAGAPSSDAASSLTIGNRISDLARGFSGSIDDVRVYNRILSAAEIAALANPTAPPAPTGLIVTATSSSEIDLAWTASAGATGYRIERCQGASCATFAQIGTPSQTIDYDTARTAATSYSYRVRAEASGQLSPYSNTVTQITPASSPDCN